MSPTGDFPSITDASHTHSVYAHGNWSEPVGMFAGTTSGLAHGGQALGGLGGALRRIPATPFANQANAVIESHFANQENTMPAATGRRLVQVFIADPDENVPLKSALIYSGEQKFTDATDQELFYEIDIKSILEKHNAERVQFVNKKVKERTEYLEPVKIRDLKMVVVSIATF